MNGVLLRGHAALGPHLSQTTRACVLERKPLIYLVASEGFEPPTKGL